MGCHCTPIVKHRLDQSVAQAKEYLSAYKEHKHTCALKSAKSISKKIGNGCKCKYHRTRLIKTLYTEGLDIVDARHSVHDFEGMSEPDKENFLAQKLSEYLHLRHASPETQAAKFDCGMGWYIILKLLQLGSLVPGSLTGTLLSNTKNVIKLDYADDGPVSKGLAGLGLLMLMTLFFAQEPPSSIPKWTSSQGKNVGIFIICVIAALGISLPSMELTRQSAAHTITKFFNNTYLGDNVETYAQVCEYSNLYLNVVLGTNVFMALGAAAMTVYESGDSCVGKCGQLILALAITGVFYLYSMPYLQSGAESKWVHKITGNDDPKAASNWVVSGIINIPDVLVMMIPAYFGKYSRVINDSTRSVLEIAYAYFIGITGSVLFAILVESSFASLPVFAGLAPWAAMASIFCSWPAMIRFGAETARYLRMLPARAWPYTPKRFQKWWQQPSCLLPHLPECIQQYLKTGDDGQHIQRSPSQERLLMDDSDCEHDQSDGEGLV